MTCVLLPQERELVLKRIAEDRRSLQEKKTQPSAPTETTSPPGSSQGQRLGGTVQTSVEHNCILMVRLYPPPLAMFTYA